MSQENWASHTNMTSYPWGERQYIQTWYSYKIAWAWQYQQNDTCAPAKTQISLGIPSVWSEYSLCALWVAKDPHFLQADNEDSEQTGRMPRLIWVFAGRTCHFVGFVMLRLIYYLSGAVHNGNNTVVMDFQINLSRDMTKPNKMSVRPAKTQISLGIRPVWSESSLSA